MKSQKIPEIFIEVRNEKMIHLLLFLSRTHSQEIPQFHCKHQCMFLSDYKLL